MIASRRLLIAALHALAEFSDALTVVGAHATHLRIQQVVPTLGMQDTRDADTAVTPELVAPNPKFFDELAAIGVVPALADRPGIYGLISEAHLAYEDRVTIDLIAPDAYAGAGRRSARIPGQDKSVTRSRGMELAVWDRDLMSIATFDEPQQIVEAWVAGPAALLIAKAHKVHDRWLEEQQGKKDRLRMKDSGDIALLMLTHDPVVAAQTMQLASVAHPEITSAVTCGIGYLISMYADPESILRGHMRSALTILDIDEIDFENRVADWLVRFAEATS
ncbi:MAG: hypothetical protein LBH11_01095 [Propionibacteriaceae bacterium]|nr:hypothetical protein [Propionibacteriaceae bacterium]